jgi:plastocyanin
MPQVRMVRNGSLALVATVALIVGGCSSSKKTEETSTGGAPVSISGKVNDHGTSDQTASGSVPRVEMELDDNYFGPTYVKVQPGATVTFELRNEGSRQHTLTTDDGVDTAVDPDGTGEAVVTAPESGQLVFYCRFHRNTGMQGAIVATDAAAGGGQPGGPSSSATPSSTTTTRASSGGGGYGY